MENILKILGNENNQMSIKEIGFKASCEQSTVLKLVNRAPREIIEFHLGEYGPKYKIGSKASIKVNKATS